MPMNHADIVRAYYAAWTADDLEGVLRLCTDDIVAVNVPIGPIHGKDKVRAFLAKFGKGMTDKPRRPSKASRITSRTASRSACPTCPRSCSVTA
jgi:uncharacterized protein (TIGR02246 family)